MRVPSTMLADTMLWNLSRTVERLDRLQDQLTSGRVISRPSDDPVGMATVLRLDSAKAANEQHLKNIDDARGWLDASDRALGTIGTAIQRAQELTLQAANGTLRPEDRDAIAAELEQLREHATQTANFSMAGQYIFAGQKTQTPPFDDSVTPPVYQGDGGAIVRTIDQGIDVQINVTGDGAILPAIQALEQARAAVSSNNQAAMRAALDALGASHSTLLTAQAQIGARANRLDAQAERISDLQLTVASLRSDIQDVDQAKAITDYSTQEAVYRAALAAGSRSIQPSLLDYLR